MTTPSTVVEWADLTAEQQAAMMTVPRRTIDVQVLRLNFDLTVAEDISTSVDPTQGDIQWDSTRVVFRDLTISLSLDAPITDELTLIQVFKLYTNPLTRVTARRSRGVFVLTKPDNPIGSKIYNPATNAYDLVGYTINGQDMMALLDRNVPYSLAYLAGANVLDCIRDVYTRAGLPASTYALIDTSKSDAALSSDLVFPLVSSTTDTSSTDSTSSAAAVTSAAGDPALARSDSEDQATWVSVLDALHKQITYRAVYAGDDGRFRNVPYVDPSAVAAPYTFDADNPVSSTVATSRSVSTNLTGIPNQWVGIWDNMPSDIAPTPENGGVLVRDNLDDGPTSQAAKHGLIFPVIVHFTASSSADFTAQLDARVTADKRQVTTFAYSTRQYPDADHYNVLGLLDSAVRADLIKVQATSWQEPLGADDTQWTWTSI